MFDTHAHLADGRFNKDRAQVIERALKAKVKEILCVCCNAKELNVFWQALSSYPFIWLAAGIHPHDASKYKEMKKMLVPALRTRRFCALGEIGLDYHYMNSPPEIQKEVFKAQLKFARERDLPVIVHTREAAEDVWRILKGEGAGQTVIHCFSGEKKELERYLELGFYVSFAGMITFPSASSLRNLVSLVPLDRLLLETDCPYLAPQPVRGRRNEPAFVRHTLEEMARIRHISAEELGEITTQNARMLFRIDQG